MATSKKMKSKPTTTNSVVPFSLPGGVVATENSLTLPKGLTDSDIRNLFGVLCKASDASKWWLGDAINALDADYGDKRMLLIDTYCPFSGKSISTLDNYGWVANRFPISDRTELSFTHHQKVAKLSRAKRNAILKKAIKNGWSVRELVDEISPKMSAEEIQVRQKISKLADDLILDAEPSEPRTIDGEVVEVESRIIDVEVEDAEVEGADVGDADEVTEFKRPKVGFKRAYEAIEVLSSIPAADEQREGAFSTVIDWIEANRWRGSSW